jgi:hypothetical protein
VVDFNIPAGTTQTISGLSANSIDTIEGNATAAYGAGGGTLNSTGPLPGQCNVTVTGGVFDVDGVANNDTITLNNATLDMTGGTWNATTTINFGTGSSGVIVPSGDATSPNLGGVKFTGLKSGDYISTGSTSPITNVSWSNGTLSFTQDGINYAVAVTLAAGTNAANLQVGTENGVPAILDGTLCFLAGTMIAIEYGECAVQNLQVGQMVRAANGELRAVQWIGVGQVEVKPGARNAATPIIVRKGALADNVPHRDLRLTKGHAIYLDDVLIPVEFLVNHRSILWDDHARAVTLYHVELLSHDVLIANGAACESYRDDGNRWLFGNANSGWGLTPQPPCAPVLTGGPMVDALWRRFLDRAGTRPGFRLTDDPDLHLLVDGRRVDPKAVRGRYSFALPPQSKEVWLVSRASAPDEIGVARDPRVLGVPVRRIVADDTVIPASDVSLREGFHNYEPAERIRWTNGRARLPEGAATITVTTHGSTRYAL